MEKALVCNVAMAFAMNGSSLKGVKQAFDEVFEYQVEINK